MRPLELTIYPKVEHYGHETGEWFYGCDACVIDLPEGTPKRLTDAELAAEYWAEAADPSLMYPYEADLRRLTLLRFATLPHFDEGTV